MLTQRKQRNTKNFNEEILNLSLLNLNQFLNWKQNLLNFSNIKIHQKNLFSIFTLCPSQVPGWWKNKQKIPPFIILHSLAADWIWIKN